MLTEARLEVPPAETEVWSDALQRLGDARWSVYEDVDARSARLCGYFADESAARAAWSELRRSLRGTLRPAGAPVLRSVADEDWRESYKAHFKAWRHGRLHWVPEWERGTHRVPRGHAAVYLDPGMAFGTGNHETTRLCVRELVRFAGRLTPAARRGRHVVDAGCGSGILAISAAKLGFPRVFAFDNDREAVAVARKNARRNNSGTAVRTATAGLETALRSRRADLLLANIQSDVLVQHAPLLVHAVRPGGWLVLSGILAREVEGVAERFREAAAGGRITTRLLGEWASVTWVSPGR